MKYLTRKKYDSIIDGLNSAYWKEGRDYRWEYMSYAIDELKQIGPRSILEAGASGLLLCDDSTVVDISGSGVNHDLNIIPWPFGDKAFDAFVALQVWEHLDNHPGAFREVRRIAKSAILSFPYKWTWGDARHNGIDEKKISEWTEGLKPVRIKKIETRIVYTWRF